MTRSFDCRRRDFLVRGCRSLPAALLAGWTFPQCAPGQGTPLVDASFHLHPYYRSASPLDATLRKIDAAFDDFESEKYHDRIAATLARWSAALLQSPTGLQAVRQALAPDFRAAGPLPVQTHTLRSGASLGVGRVSFSQDKNLNGAAFVQQLMAALSTFSKLHTADFQITGIDLQPEGAVSTRVRYELVGSGPGFHREQRAGIWALEWKAGPENQLLLRSWQSEDETRTRSSKPWYSDIAPHAFGRASSFSDQLLPGVDHWRTILDGASGIDIYGHNGVSLGDIDGDGLDDLYVCQPAGLPNRLYRNRGDGTFDDITEASGVGLLDNTACAIFADFDRDGRQDLVVVRASGPLLFLNQGGGKFRLRPDAFQFATPPQGTFTGAAAADYDRDGWLDIYFCLYAYYQGADQYKYPLPYYAAENGPPNFLMRNNRDGSFRDVTAQTGLNQNNTRYSFCCGWGDFNADGWPDLYVVNDFGRKNLYRNNGDGTFTDVARQAGVEDVGAGMGVCWFDYDNDGAEDLYVADMWTAAGKRIASQKPFQSAASEEIRALYLKHEMGNSLFRNQGSRYQDVTAESGTGLGRWAWSSDAWDFDHDGWADVYVVNGMVSGPVRDDLNSFFWRQVVAKSPASAQPSESYEQGWNAINELIRADYTWSGYERNVFFANNGDGMFSDVSGATGLDFLEDGRAFALGDFDRDGRLEVFLKSRTSPQLRLLKNVVEDLPPSIAFRLRGIKSNPDAIGARVVLENEAGRQTQTVQAGSGFLSQHSKELLFGLGRAKGPLHVSIHWPSGLVQEIRNLPANHRVWIDEGSEPSRVEPFEKRESVAAATANARPLAETFGTWLLTPVRAPDFTFNNHSLRDLRGRPALLHLCKAPPGWPPQPFQVLAVSFDGVAGADDIAGIYNVLYRGLFDRRRDITLPISFLLDAQGDIVKVYQGTLDPRRVGEDIARIPQTAAERLAVALPFRGSAETYEFGRNHLSLGSAFFQRGYYDQAAAAFQDALRDEPGSGEAHYGLGSVYLKQEKLGDARASFEQAVKLAAAYPNTTTNALNNLGLLATRENRTSDAIGYFQEALKLNPDYWIALENLGNAYRQQRRWDDALVTLERAVAARPEEPEANYSLAMVYAQTDDTDRAYRYLQAALTLRPAYPEALNNLGVLYLRTRRRDEAVAKFQECIRVAPGFDQAYLNLARVYALEGGRDRARAVLLDLLKQRPDHAQAQRALDELR
jgi:tetratricopeptide (TPR) repeat protein